MYIGLRFDRQLTEALAILSESEYKFSSTQINITGDLSKRILAFAAGIPDASLAEDGREDKFHVTCKYGLHTNDVDKVREVLGGYGPFMVTLGKVSMFPPHGDHDFDVLKIDVKGAKLHELNALISAELECTDKYPEYKPHLTLAYMKPGEATQYVDDDSFEGEEIEVTSIEFSPKDGPKKTITLGDKI